MHFDPCYKFLARLREKEDMLEKLQLSSGKFINYDEKSGKIVPAKNRDAKAHFKQIEDITSEIHIMQDQLERVAELYNKLGMSEPVYNLINAKRDQLEHRRRKQVRNLNGCISIVSQRLNIPADKCEDQPDVKKWRSALNATEEELANLPDNEKIVKEINAILSPMN
jgi:CRISPR/Cas system-associated endonuclease Cas3-HD